MNKARKLAGEWGPGVLLTLGTLWVLQGALALTPGHGVIVQGLNYDAGTVKSGMIVHAAVNINNLSAQTIEVVAKPSCGCTLLSNTEQTVFPLQRKTIVADVDTYGMQDGTQKKGVMLTVTEGRHTWSQLAYIGFSIHSLKGER